MYVIYDRQPYGSMRMRRKGYFRSAEKRLCRQTLAMVAVVRNTKSRHLRPFAHHCFISRMDGLVGAKVSKQQFQ